jgi:hypothetical protein
MHRAAATQGTHMIANQGVVLTAPSSSKSTHWWINGLLEWGQAFGAHLCHQGHPPVYAGKAGPVHRLLPKNLQDSCITLQVHRLADLLELDSDSNLVWSASFPDFRHHLPSEVPTPIIFPLSADQYWSSSRNSDLLQILHYTDTHIVIRRWFPDLSQAMSYVRSNYTERLTRSDVFPGPTATRVPVIHMSPTTGTACCRRLQPSPDIASLPPAPPKPWIQWVLSSIWGSRSGRAVRAKA